MKRRDMLKGAPSLLALPVVGIAAGEGIASADTLVIRAYREWKAGLDAWNKAVEGDITDEEGAAWCNKVMDLADNVLDQPSTGAMDFVYKLMAQSFHGEHDISSCPRGDELWAEARGMVEV